MASSSVYKDGDTEVIADINVTPLVDVVLVLLVIFMVTAPIIAGRGISVNAPATVSGDSVATPLQVTLTKDGKIYVKGVLPADAEVPHGEVMKAIDSVKRADITKFALASKKPEKTDD
jgi:biopolymer transport protein ExbD